MTRTLDFYWDFSSPYAYLAASQVEAVAARANATLHVRPMLLGAVFRAVGQVDAPVLTWSEAKRRHTMRDMDRWAEYWGVPFRFPTRFPMGTVKALRTYLALPEEKKRPFRDATFRAYWAEDRDIANEGVLAELVTSVGGDAKAIAEAVGTTPIKDALFAATEHAVKQGVFGAPTWVVDGTELFWGQDRVALVERALASAGSSA